MDWRCYTFTNDSYKIKLEELNEAKKLKIKIVQNDIPVKIRVNKKGSITGVVCKSGRRYPGDIIVVDDQGFVKVNKMQRTVIPSVYAVGYIATDRHYLVLAAASGALAAMSIYESRFTKPF